MDHMQLEDMEVRRKDTEKKKRVSQREDNREKLGVKVVKIHICVYVCMHMYIYKCMYIYDCKYMCIYVYTHMYTCVSIHAYIYIFMYMCIFKE